MRRSTAWKPEPWYPLGLMARFVCMGNTRARTDEENKPLVGTVVRIV